MPRPIRISRLAELKSGGKPYGNMSRQGVAAQRKISCGPFPLWCLMMSLQYVHLENENVDLDQVKLFLAIYHIPAMQ